MKQSSLGLSNTTKRTRKREFLDAMELVVPWAELVSLIEPYSRERSAGPAALCSEHAFAYPLYAAVVQAQRPGDGRSVARRASLRGLFGESPLVKQITSGATRWLTCRSGLESASTACTSGSKPIHRRPAIGRRRCRKPTSCAGSRPNSNA